MQRIWILVFIFALSYSLIILGCSDDVNIPPASTRLVVLLTPDNDTILPNASVSFTWTTTSQNADSFKFQISQDSTFVSVVETYGTTNTQFQLDPSGDSNYFYWKVTGYWRSLGDSDISSTRKFKQQ